MWETDMTLTATVREGGASVFDGVEHTNSEAVGIHVAAFVQSLRGA
jgi:hypothetical protein